MKIVIGTDGNNIVMAAAIVADNPYLKDDVCSFVLSGLTVKVIEADSVTVGEAVK